ncbi:hypothetical protein NQD34_000799 [Periophthalmus magnuspinnatus]|nr:hypothetical protein NQD34_000799 [Periophthalmus magnuspinnatus]
MFQLKFVSRYLSTRVLLDFAVSQIPAPSLAPAPDPALQLQYSPPLVFASCPVLSWSLACFSSPALVLALWITPAWFASRVFNELLPHIISQTVNTVKLPRVCIPWSAPVPAVTTVF